MANCILTSATPTAEYTLPYNPSFYTTDEDETILSKKILHGAPVWHEVKFDNRIRALSWSGYEASNSDIQGIVTFFKNKKGMTYYINFQDMDTMNLLWPTNDTWKKIRIVNITSSFRKGGTIVYDNISLTIQPEE